MSCLVGCSCMRVSRIAETLSDDVLAKMHAPPKPDYPILAPSQLASFDAFLFGIPTRYGNFPAQWKVRLVAPLMRIPSHPLQAFWDHTGGLWLKGSLAGKFAGVFVSTGTPGGGQETTVITSLSTLMHHGMIFVPLGYSRTFSLMGDMSQVRGGTSHRVSCRSRWGV